MSETFVQEPGDGSSMRILEDLKRRRKRQESFPGLEKGSDQEILARIKHKRGGLSDDEFNEIFAGESIAPPLKRELGAPIDKSKGLRKRQPNSGMFRTRAVTSFLGDNFEEQQAAFKGLHPGGHLLRVPVTGQILYKTKPDEPYRKLDPSFAEAMGADGLSGFLDEFENDIADLTADGAVIAGETAGIVFLRKKGVGQFLGDMVRLGVGGAAGEAARQIAQTAEGTQRQDPKQQRSLITGAGALSIVGGTIGAAGGAVVGGLSRRGVVNTTEEGRAAIKASEDIGTEPLMASQVSRNPFLKSLSRQSQALVPKIGDYLLKQEKKTANALREAINPAALKKFIGETARTFNQASNDLLELTIQATGIRRRSPRAGGRVLQQGVERWWKVSGKDVDALYEAMRRIGEPIYDGTNLLEGVARLKQGLQLAGKPTTRQVDTGLKDASGNPIFREETVESAIKTDDELAGAVERLLDDMAAIDPNIRGVGNSALDGLRGFRRRVNEFRVAGPEGSRLSHSLANDLVQLIDDTIENPINLHAVPGLSGALGAANGAARKRFQTREQLAVVDLMKSETPAQIVGKLARPGQLDNLVAVRKAVPQEEWAKFQESVVTELMLDPANLATRMAEFDQPTLNLLMNGPRQQIMKEAGTELAGLFSVGVEAGLKKQTQIRGFFKSVLDTENTAQITQFANVIERQGGKEGPLGLSARSAVINEIWQRSRVAAEGAVRVDANKISKTLTDFDERGLLDFLTEGDIELLRNVELVQDFARLGAADAGTSLQQASAVADVRGGGLRGLTTIVENWTMGNLLTRPGLNRFLLGSGKNRPLDTAFIKLITAANLQIAADVEQTAELGEDVESLIRSGASSVTGLLD